MSDPLGAFALGVLIGGACGHFGYPLVQGLIDALLGRAQPETSARLDRLAELLGDTRRRKKPRAS